MYAVANFRERVILSMATDLGLGIGDFLQIKKADLPDLSLEAPIAFDVMTDKEDVIAKGFLSQETVDLLKKYVDTLSGNNPFLFPSNQKKNKPISKSQMGNLLKDLAEKAEIKVANGKSLSFHCFRKMFKRSNRLRSGFDGRQNSLRKNRGHKRQHISDHSE